MANLLNELENLKELELTNFHKQIELIARETLVIRHCGFWVEFYGSEVAVLRIEHRFRWAKDVEAQYCKTLDQFFVVFKVGKI